MTSRPDPDLLQRWIRDGVPPSRIGALLGLSRATGYEWLRRYAIRSGGPAPRQAELVTRWRSGPASAERVAEETDLPPDAVMERLITSGAIPSSRPYVLVGASQDPLSEERLRRWHVDEGRTAATIAAMTGTTIRQVRYRLSQYGLSRRRSTPAPAASAPPPRVTAVRLDPALIGRVHSSHERARTAAAAAAGAIGQITETLERLRATTLAARRAAERTGARRSNCPERR